MNDEQAIDLPYPLGAMPLVRQKRRRLRLSLGVGLLLGPAVALAFTLVGGTAAIYGWVAGGVTSFLGLLMAFAFWLDDRRTLFRLAAFQRGECLAHWHYSSEEWQAYDATWTPALPVGEVFIGRDCALCGGTFVQWNVIGCSLEKVIYVEGPPVLIQFILYHYDPNGGSWRESICIPVPAGKEAEASVVLRTIIQGSRNSYIAIVITVALALFSFLLLGLSLAVWAGIIK